MDTLQAIYFGQRHADFNYKDYELIQRVKRLTKKHQRQCENDCNGEGIVRGEFYRDGTIPGSYVNGGETTIFSVEIIRIEEKIKKLLTKGFTIKFQHDPRGYTVKLFYKGDFVVL